MYTWQQDGAYAPDLMVISASLGAMFPHAVAMRLRALPHPNTIVRRHGSKPCKRWWPGAEGRPAAAALLPRQPVSRAAELSSCEMLARDVCRPLSTAIQCAADSIHGYSLQTEQHPQATWWSLVIARWIGRSTATAIEKRTL